MTEIKGKTALVTGASKGIGKAIALALAKEGVHIGVNYHSDAGSAENLCKQIEGLGAKAIPIKADVSDAASVSVMVQEVEENLGPVEILVNNAGIAHKDELENITEADWDRVIDTNLKSAFLVTQACIGTMKQQQWGRIINISSVAAQTGGVTGPLYAASKAGMIGLTHSYALFLINDGITANAITPALIETDMVKELKASPDKIPMGRFGQPNEVADAVIMLVKNAYMTGQTVGVNGGLYFS
ncbi:SDR family NAD(P)-dependent oxidoreductase [Pontibacter silvestris]|uniref:SDR family NAD(P)-dependent oxidoreductase n=1 Tax=Pontibacter silvestris TaxID=2305183 RepID=A0ABW4WZP7_9BACT|nr:3-oxoacyl-ACP reductase family protein [Pontibacter silvestris]MCC9135160.1 3-oxoacyl-ACP reductase FabG [Pontibacter silvestris]